MLLSNPAYFKSSSSSAAAANLSFSAKPLVKSQSLISAAARCGIRSALITTPDAFEVGRLIGTYGFMNVTSYKGLQPGDEVDLGSAAKDIGRLKLQDVGEGGVKIRLYEGRVAQGPQRGTPIIFKVYPGKRAGGVEADMMAANELSAHSFLQNHLVSG